MLSKEQSDELWRLDKEIRDAEWAERQPDLAIFRALPEEIIAKQEDCKRQGRRMWDPPIVTPAAEDFRQFAKDLELLLAEGRRFEVWREAQQNQALPDDDDERPSA